MKKITLHTIGNRISPGGAVEIEPERVLCNDVTFAGEFNPHHTRLWVIGNEFGALGAVWAQCEQDALDELVDKGLGDGLLIDVKDADEETSFLGNAGEPADLTYCWMNEVDFKPERDWQLMIKFAEARGACADTLDDV